MADSETSTVRTVGNEKLLVLPKTSFLSSRRISPAAVLKCYDWATRMRDGGHCVISGFHSPLEKDVLKFLLKGSQPIVLVLARRMYRTMPEELREGIGAGRLLVVSPVPDGVRRAGSSSALLRNRYILSHSETHVFGSLDPEGTLAPLVRELPPGTVEILGVTHADLGGSAHGGRDRG